MRSNQAASLGSLRNRASYACNRATVLPRLALVVIDSPFAVLARPGAPDRHLRGQPEAGWVSLGRLGSPGSCRESATGLLPLPAVPPPPTGPCPEGNSSILGGDRSRWGSLGSPG